MKKGTLLTLLTLALVLPLQADERERHQSYISYDDGGTILRSGEDGKEIEAHRNLPVYPGDEVITARRGRAEIHLSDGNIIGVDRATAVRFRSILDSYDGDSDETVGELRHGKIAVHRTDIGRDYVRLDTDHASYVASHEAIYSIETDSRGNDRVIVFDGSLEVRTPSRASRLRAGESASVNDRGVYDLIGDQRYAADDFERWFLKRAERYGTYTSKYMDRRLSYWADDLDDHGRWVFVTGIGWSWRPYVAAGWRPYYHGYWANRRGCLTWVSYDPWGWGTYHYGRWAYDPFNGWVWVPGYGYSPAWVYWWYGSNHIGWAPRGYWDCHRGYYDWAYRPYRDHGSRFGFGFYGRVRIDEIDLRPWTFVDPTTIVSTRVDRAALTTDAIKGRLGRGNGGFATISGAPARFTREELRDPAETIRRRGLGTDAGVEAGTPADLTPFFRRDPQVPSSVRDRITRVRGGSPAAPATGGSTPTRTVGGGGLAPIGGGSSVAPIGRGNVAPIGGGSVAPIGGGSSAGSGSGRTSGSEGRVNRGGADNRPQVRVIGGDDNATPRDDTAERPSGGSWRDRVRRGGEDAPQSVTPPPETPTPNDSTGSRSGGSDSWRNRGRGGDAQAAPPPAASGNEPSSRGGSDVPRRVIDRIGGARVYPRDSSGSGSSTRGSSSSGSRDRGTVRGSDRSSSSRGSSSRGSSVDRGSRGSSGSRDTGRSYSPPPSSNRGSSGSGSVDRGSRSSGSDSGSRSSGSSSRSSGDSGGRSRRDNN
ncbi:MAG TPA: DUF6600 domain-containing protein [Thermoanaerobaculia bacterium]|nr:DUF6600 domain-containing protein [Thermoanaerobaculia bacterium]